jgi:hypothetical protein
MKTQKYEVSTEKREGERKRERGICFNKIQQYLEPGLSKF